MMFPYGSRRLADPLDPGLDPRRRSRERLARIESFLGIGMSEAAAPNAASAATSKQHPGEAEESDPG